MRRARKGVDVRMISETSAYVIVDNKDDILLGTLASSRHDAWENLMEKMNYRTIFVSRDEAKRRGFKCVPARIQTEEYYR
jgi:hypothetical protein